MHIADPFHRFKNILFVPDSADFVPESYRVLQDVLAELQALPEARIEIGGHTDNINTHEHNLSLSQRRADAVRNYLIERGVDPDRLVAVGYGESFPVDDNTTADGRWNNRRIEMKLLGVFTPPAHDFQSPISPPLVRRNMEHENYLHCNEYEGKPAHPSEMGFTAFRDSSEFYFALLDANGRVLLKSEGYPQEPSRENGIQSVKKNRVNKDFYSVKKDTDGTFYVSLRAGNYREIARSCSCSTEQEAKDLIPYLTGEKVRAVQSVATEPPREEDDYLVCGEYRGHPGVGAEFPGMVKFTHNNKQHYFAWYDDNGNVLMRSEGYPTMAARDNGMASVVKNREIEERYSIEKVRNFYFVVLKAGNRQEIARSCPLESEDAAKMYYPGRRRAKQAPSAVPIAAATVGAATVAASVAAAKVLASEMPAVSPPAPEVKVTPPSVPDVKIAPPPPPELKVAAPPPPPVSIPDPAPIPRVATPVAPVATGGSKLWWLLLPALALGVWWMWPKKAPEVSMPDMTSPAITEAPKVEAPAPAATPVKKEVLRWIFFDFDRSELRVESRAELDKMAAIMKEFAGVTGVLRAHTDAKGSSEYNLALSRRRADAAKQYLMSLGIPATRIETEFSGAADPIARNQVGGSDTEQGRQFNRRVELLIKGTAGEKLVVESRPPDVPSELKAK